MTVSSEPRLTRDYLDGLCRNMAARRIVVLGDAMLDIYLSGEAERISPEAPVPVVAVDTRRSALGGAANVAANVGAIGAECRLVAVIGDDPRADSFRAELAQHRLADRYMVVVAARPTTSKTRVMARGQQGLRIDEEVDDPISAPPAWSSSPRTSRSTVSRLWRARCSTFPARATRSRHGRAARSRRGRRCVRPRRWPTTQPASRSASRGSPRCHPPKCWRLTTCATTSWESCGAAGCCEAGACLLTRARLTPRLGVCR